MKKKLVFLAMIAMALVFAMTVTGCEDDPDDDGGVYTPTSIKVYYDIGIQVSGFGVSRADSVLPGADSGGKITDSSCGFSITVGGSNVPVAEVRAGTSAIGISPNIPPLNCFTVGQSVTLSYAPNGTHIFKNSKGKTLGAFTLSATAQ
jgi:hypothetical protein